MKISVVTVVLNVEADFALTAESVLAQDHGNMEWVVIDGCSWSDAGRRHLSRYESLCDKYVSSPDDGVYSAMNDATQLATGDYLVFLNAGDIFYRADTLSDVAVSLKDKPSILYGDHDYVSSGVHSFRRAGDMQVIMDRLKTGDVKGDWHGSIPCHQATFYHRSVFDEMEFDEALQITADHDFLMRAYMSGYSIRHAEIMVCRYYGGGFSSRLIDRCEAEWADVYARFSDYPTLVRQHFLGEEVTRNFAVSSSHFVLGGHYQFEGPNPNISDTGFVWVKEEGLTIVSTCIDDEALIALRGFSRFKQEMTISHRGLEDRTIQLGEGKFHLKLNLSQPIKMGDKINIRTDRAEKHNETDQRVTGWAFGAIDLGEAARTVSQEETRDPIVIRQGVLSDVYSDAEIILPLSLFNIWTGDHLRLRFQVYRGRCLLEFRPDDQPDIIVPEGFEISEDQWGKVVRIDLEEEGSINIQGASTSIEPDQIDLAMALSFVFEHWTKVALAFRSQAPAIFPLFPRSLPDNQ